MWLSLIIAIEYILKKKSVFRMVKFHFMQFRNRTCSHVIFTHDNIY